MGPLPPRVARTGVCLAWLLAFASCGSDGAGGNDDGPSASVDARPDGPIARYLTDGQLDPGFGSQGLVTTTVSDREQRARAVALQSDGKLVVVGENRPGLPDDDFDFTLVRHLTDGSPATTAARLRSASASTITNAP